MISVKNKIIYYLPRSIVGAAALLFLLYSQNLYSSYGDDFGAGARVIAMGGAGLSIGDDIYSSLLNPAALAYLKRGQLAFEYGRPHINLQDGSNIAGGFGGIAWPFIKEEILEMGAASSTETARTTSAIVRTLSSALMFGYKNLSLEGYYSESVYRLTYARFLGKRLALGVSLKALSDEFIVDQYLRRSAVFGYGDKNSKNSYTADAGFIWNPWPRFFVGVSGIDLTEPDIGYLSRENLPATYRFGVGMRKSDYKYGFDISYRPTSPLKELEATSGFEKTYRDKIILRGGFAWSRVASGFSGWRFSSGLGFNVSESITLDYALTYPLTDLKETYGSHYLSFVFQFGSLESSEELEPGSLERAYRELSEEKFRLESRLAKTETEKRKLEEVLIEEATSRIREKIKQTREPAVTPAQQQVEAAPKTIGAKIIAASRTHIVKKGDTLQTLAQKYYNDSKLWVEIYNANRDDIGRGGTLKPNQILIIPPLPGSATGGITPQTSAVVTEPFPSKPRTESPTVDTALKLTPIGGNIITPTPLSGGETIEKPTIIPIPIEKVAISTTTPPQAAKPSSASEKIKPETKASPTKTAATSKKTHIVKAGENLRSIAEKYYNNPEKWREILAANKDKIIRGRVQPGIELTIP